ncbi:Repressor of RNA polymerase III transcription MAF1 [Yarrowia sp. B02]|nr:Repressor of RNA polymerase III transcription MAF1 [Yarrowia sp. B02]
MQVTELETLASALKFDTPECHVSGAIDLYTTKPASSDKKLYKALDKQLSYHQDALDSFASISTLGTSISPPQVLSFESFYGKSLDSSVSRMNRSPKGVTKVPKQRTFSSSRAGVSVGSLSPLVSSPFGDMSDTASKKVFAYLIAILNASDPNHDFSVLQPDDFQREPSASAVIGSFNNVLFGLGMPIPHRMWDVLDLQIEMRDCTIFSFTPDATILADEPGALWSLSWFFFNKRKKRVACISLNARRHSLSPTLGPKVVRSDVINGDDEEDYDLTYSSDTDMYDEIVGELDLE